MRKFSNFHTLSIMPPPPPPPSGPSSPQALTFTTLKPSPSPAPLLPNSPNHLPILQDPKNENKIKYLANFSIISAFFRRANIRHIETF